MSGRLPGSARRSRLLGRRNVRTAPPAPPAASLRPPGELPEAARRVWRRDAPTVPGGLKAADVSSFAVACRVEALTETLLGRAETALAAMDGAARTPNVLWAAAKLATLAAALRRPFGLSPVDRQGLHAEPEEEDDDLARFRRENPRG